MAGRTPISSSAGESMVGGGGGASMSALIEATGSILFNGRQPTAGQIRQAVGYVLQDDFLLPSLTVRETLTFAARLRLTLPPAARAARVGGVLRLLGLRDCAGTLVGGDDVKGVSGGEKRRLSLGLQMLINPSALLLDEPTTGLDAFSAHHGARRALSTPPLPPLRP